jgi:MFS family permease
VRRQPLGRPFNRFLSAAFVSNVGDGVAQIGYPWLASAITRNPILIAGVTATGMLPWLLVTLPAGAIADRVDRRRILITADTIRCALTVVVAIVVLMRSDRLPSPDEITGGVAVGTDVVLYVVLVLSSLALGVGQVFRDTTAQSFLPQVLGTDSERLERGNARLGLAEQIGNMFVGPALGGLLIGVALWAPFVFDASSFAIAAALVAVIGGTAVASRPPSVASGSSVRSDIREGWRWLRGHRLLWSMAVSLGLVNGIAQIHEAVYVLYAQEILGTTPFTFAAITMVAAAGGIVGGVASDRLTGRISVPTVIRVGLLTQAVVAFGASLLSSWPVYAALLFIDNAVIVAWNVVTVSFRQSLIPSELLGRVNSIYRFIAWGTIPVGALLSGVLVSVISSTFDRAAALRSAFWIPAVLIVVLLAWTWRRVTPEAVSAARERAS